MDVTNSPPSASIAVRRFLRPAQTLSNEQSSLPGSQIRALIFEFRLCKNYSPKNGRNDAHGLIRKSSYDHFGVWHKILCLKNGRNGAQGLNTKNLFNFEVNLSIPCFLFLNILIIFFNSMSQLLQITRFTHQKLCQFSAFLWNIKWKLNSKLLRI